MASVANNPQAPRAPARVPKESGIGMVRTVVTNADNSDRYAVKLVKYIPAEVLAVVGLSTPEAENVVAAATFHLPLVDATLAPLSAWVREPVLGRIPTPPCLNHGRALSCTGKET